MDWFNPDDWTKLETAFTSAPRWACVVAASVVVGVGIWLFRGNQFKTERANLVSEKAAEKAGFEGRISILDERLKFASDKSELAGQTGSELGDELRNEFKTEIETLKMGMVDMPDKAEIAAAFSAIGAKMDAKIDVGFAKLATANAAVSHAMSPPSATGSLEGASMKFGVGTFGPSR
jgi:hypothetical protein